MSLAGVLVLAYCFGVLPGWFASELWASRSGVRSPLRVATLWLSRGLAIAGVSWGALAFILGSAGLWSDVADLWRQYHSQLLRGYAVTIALTLVSFALSLAAGGVAALLRVSEYRALRVVSGAYIEWFRNTPLLIQLFFWFFGVPRLVLPVVGRPDWFLLSPWTASILGLTLYTGAYTAEAFRSGLIAVDRGQTEAARSLGLTYLQTRLFVVGPQALRVAVPLLTSIFSALFRNSALCSAIGLTELLRASLNVGEETFKTYEALALGGVLYLSLTVPLAWASTRLEHRVAGAR